MALKSKYDGLRSTVEDSDKLGVPIAWDDDALPMESHPDWKHKPVTPEDFYYSQRPGEAKLNVFRQMGNSHRLYKLSMQ